MRRVARPKQANRHIMNSFHRRKTVRHPNRQKLGRIFIVRPMQQACSTQHAAFFFTRCVPFPASRADLFLMAAKDDTKVVDEVARQVRRHVMYISKFQGAAGVVKDFSTRGIERVACRKRQISRRFRAFMCTWYGVWPV